MTKLQTIQTSSRINSAGLGRAVAWVGVALLAATLVAEILVGRGHPLWQDFGHDYETYMTAAARWLGGGPFYEPYQLAGPYAVIEREILYPPVALWLFAPFTFLPAVAWWVVPLGIVAWVVASYRPAPWAWLLILGLLTQPTAYGASWSLHMISNGNPSIWIAAFVALATRWPYFGPFAILKPVPLLAPLALVGVTSRWWWVGLGTLAVASLALLPMWPDYLRVLLHAEAPGSAMLYALGSLPLALVPLVAYVSRSRVSQRIASATSPS